jgi:hypothetical protein
MGIAIDRSPAAREKRTPDLFLSYSSRDRAIVRKVAEDLALCQVDVWLDSWELQPGDSIGGVIAQALAKTRYVAVVLGDNFADSGWAERELKQALARERRGEQSHVIPVVCGAAAIPAFLEDKLYVDLRTDYCPGIVRLSALVHGIGKQRIEDAIATIGPTTSNQSVECLRYCGFEPHRVLSRDDFDEIASAGAIVTGARMRFWPYEVMGRPVSPRIRDLMKRIVDEDDAPRTRRRSRRR